MMFVSLVKYRLTLLNEDSWQERYDLRQKNNKKSELM